MRFLSSLLTAALLLSTTPALAAPPSHPVEIALEPYLGVLWSFRADDGGRYLLDTAGGLTAITPDTARKAGCQPWGRITGHRMRGDRIDLTRCDGVWVKAGGLVLAPPTVGVLDFSKLLPADAPTLEGSVALDAFAGRAVTLDLGHQRLVVETPESLKARVKGASAVPVRLARDAGGLALTPFIPMSTPKGPIWVELDSGSTGAVVIAQHDAALLGLDPEAKGAQPLEASIQGGPSIKAQALVMDLIIDGNIGIPVLKDWVITLDLANGKAWIKPAT